MGNPYAPTDETPAMLDLDRTNLIGAIFGGAAWGLHAIVAVLCAQSLIRAGTKRMNNIMLGFTFVLFVMGTLNFVGNTVVTSQMFVDNRMFPGGPSAYLGFIYSSSPSNIMSNASYVVGNFMTDGLLLYRTFVVWNKSYTIVVLPGLLYIGSTILSILSIFETAQPGASLWTHTSFSVSLAYFSVSITLNTLLTLLIAGRALFIRTRVVDALGPEHGRIYTNMASIALESALPYAAFSLAFIATYASNNPAQNVLLPILSQVMCLSSELIVWRLALGQGWDEHTLQRTSRPPSISVPADKMALEPEDNELRVPSLVTDARIACSLHAA